VGSCKAPRLPDSGFMERAYRPGRLFDAFQQLLFSPTPRRLPSALLPRSETVLHAAQMRPTRRRESP